MGSCPRKDTLTLPLLGTDWMSRPTGDRMPCSAREFREGDNMEVATFPEPPRPIVCYIKWIRMIERNSDQNGVGSKEERMDHTLAVLGLDLKRNTPPICNLRGGRLPSAELSIGLQPPQRGGI